MWCTPCRYGVFAKASIKPIPVCLIGQIGISWRDVSMKSFVCSLCHNGILGGGLYLDSQSLTYKTNKLTVDKKYRNLVLPMQEIKEISWKWIVFPIATVNMKNGELYKFIIFNKSRFAKWFQEYSR